MSKTAMQILFFYMYHPVKSRKAVPSAKASGTAVFSVFITNISGIPSVQFLPYDARPVRDGVRYAGGRFEILQRHIPFAAAGVKDVRRAVDLPADRFPCAAITC